jgi:hypothetical protein
MLEFADPGAEHQFQQSFAAGRRYWDAAAALIVLACLLPYVNFLALEARVCPSCPTSATCPPSLTPAWHLHPVLRTFPCSDDGTTPAAKLPRALWWLRHWGPATLALYRINGDLEGYVGHLGCIAALAHLFWTRGGEAARGGAYSKQRTLLLSIWRVGKCVSGALVLLVCRLQLLPGWTSGTWDMHWGQNTMFGATRLLWHAHLMAVSAPAGLACVLFLRASCCRARAAASLSLLVQSLLLAVSRSGRRLLQDTALPGKCVDACDLGMTSC